MPNENLPDWEWVLAAAAHLQRILPDAVLVGSLACIHCADLIFDQLTGLKE